MQTFFAYRRIISVGLIFLCFIVIAMRFSVAESAAAALYAALSPLFAGTVIAFVLNILVTRIESLPFPCLNASRLARVKRPVAVILAILSVVALVTLVLRMAIPQTINSLRITVEAFPGVYTQVSDYVLARIAWIPYLDTHDILKEVSGGNLTEQIARIGSVWAKSLIGFMGNTLHFVVDMTIGFIFAVYILLNKESLNRQAGLLMRAYLSEKSGGRLVRVARVAADTFGSFFVGQFLDAIILGLMMTITLTIFGVPYASNIGSVVGLTALVPLLGAYIGGIIGLVMLLSVSLFDAVLFLAILLVVQQIEGNFIYPRIVGNSVGLPGIWVFAAVTVGANLFGVSGILFSVPVAATLYKLLRADMMKRLEVR